MSESNTPPHRSMTAADPTTHPDRTGHDRIQRIDDSRGHADVELLTAAAVLAGEMEDMVTTGIASGGKVHE